MTDPNPFWGNKPWLSDEDDPTNTDATNPAKLEKTVKIPVFRLASDNVDSLSAESYSLSSNARNIFKRIDKMGITENTFSPLPNVAESRQAINPLPDTSSPDDDIRKSIDPILDNINRAYLEEQKHLQYENLPYKFDDLKPRQYENLLEKMEPGIRKVQTLELPVSETNSPLQNLQQKVGMVDFTLPDIPTGSEQIGKSVESIMGTLSQAWGKQQQGKSEYQNLPFNLSDMDTAGNTVQTLGLQNNDSLNKQNAVQYIKNLSAPAAGDAQDVSMQNDTDTYIDVFGNIQRRSDPASYLIEDRMEQEKATRADNAPETSTKQEPPSSDDNKDKKGDSSFASQKEQGINVKAVSDFEGESQRKAYVLPGAKSTTTVCSGFDAGQHNKKELQRMGMPKELIAKLEPYLDAKKTGLRGEAARTFLRKHPLVLSQEECDTVDSVVMDYKAKAGGRFYDSKVDEHNREVEAYNRTQNDESQKRPMAKRYDELSPELRTVVFSRYYHRQTAWVKDDPDFLKAVMNNDKAAAIAALKTKAVEYNATRSTAWWGERLRKEIKYLEDPDNYFKSK